jgi:hypothetical protein
MAKKSMPNKAFKLTSVVIIVIILLGGGWFILDKTQKSTSRTCISGDGLAESQCLEDYIGLPRDEAYDKAAKNGLTPHAGTFDGTIASGLGIGGYLIYFAIEDGKVTKAYFEDGRSVEL